MNREIKRMYKITLSRNEAIGLIMDNADIPEDLHGAIDNAVIVAFDILNDDTVVLRLEIDD